MRGGHIKEDELNRAWECRKMHIKCLSQTDNRKRESPLEKEGRRRQDNIKMDIVYADVISNHMPQDKG
jgi:hypothetical protein